MSDIIEMQRAIYHAAGEYYTAMGEYFVALHPAHQSPKLKEIASRCIAAAVEYRARLTALLDYALMTGASEVGEIEAERLVRLIELLDMEIQRIGKM